MESNKISIIIPMLNEKNYIAQCIESIVSCDYDNNNIEIIIIDSMSTDGSHNIVNTYKTKYSNIHSYENTKIFTPFAFNIGIKNSTGDYIFIVSAHCKYDNDYFSTLVHYAKKLNADAVGAVSKTGVLNKTAKSCAIKEVLSNKFGVGNSYFRTGTDEIIEVDAISGCYKKSVFEKYGLYDERLIRNQDIELNKRIKNGGGKLFLIPHTSYTYFVRETFRPLAKNNYKNGFWNILTAHYTKTFSSLSLRHFIPLFFVLSLLLPLLFYPLIPQLIWVTLTSLLSYILLISSVSYKLKNKSTDMPHLISCFLTLHLSYGAGSLAGVFSVFKRIIFPVP